MTKSQKNHPGQNATKTKVRMIAWWPGISQDFLGYDINCRNAYKTGLAWRKQYLLGQKQKLVENSIWTEVTLRTKVMS